MKTADPKTDGCGGCGSVPDLVAVVVKSCTFVGSAHLGIAQLYDVLASRATKVADGELFKAAAARHRMMAEDTANVVLPDGDSDGNETSAPVGSVQGSSD